MEPVKIAVPVPVDRDTGLTPLISPRMRVGAAPPAMALDEEQLSPRERKTPRDASREASNGSERRLKTPRGSIDEDAASSIARAAAEAFPETGDDDEPETEAVEAAAGASSDDDDDEQQALLRMVRRQSSSNLAALAARRRRRCPTWRRRRRRPPAARRRRRTTGGACGHAGARGRRRVRCPATPPTAMDATLRWRRPRPRRRRGASAAAAGGGGAGGAASDDDDGGGTGVRQPQEVGQARRQNASTAATSSRACSGVCDRGEARSAAGPRPQKS